MRDPIAEHGTSEWHAARRGRITASMAAAILCPGQPGVHGNPHSAWLEVTGKNTKLDDDGEPDDDAEAEEGAISPSAAAEYGRDTQEVHAKMLAKRAGIQWAVLEPGFYVSEKYPWLGASPDGIGALDGEPLTAELKAPTNLQIVKALRHGMPLPYVVQSMVQMIVCDVRQAITSVLYPPQPTWQRLHRSPELEGWVMTGLIEFWERHVVTDTPPPLDVAWLDAKTAKAISDLCPPRPGAAVYFDLGHEGCSVAAALEEAKAAKKKAVEQETFAKARLVELAGDAERIYLPDGSGYSRTKGVRQNQAREASVSEVTTLRRVKRMD